MCASEGLTAVGESCSAGYICFASAFTPTPAISVTTPAAATAGCAAVYDDAFGLCPPGHYCEAATACPTQCTAGAYSPSEGSPDSSFCLACPAGSHCDTDGLAAPTGLCPGGYFCPAGADSATANQCPLGHQCPEGSAAALACAPGTSTHGAAAG